ncbi:MAG TPA: hypothetical protein VFU31_26080 [Candidatus Binatia bacterium]|nr:hypothetical protein [Candidatus Binatia bacterium]
MPSILCYKETAPESWVEHFCLVKPDAMFAEENSASEAAENHLAEARAVMDAESDIHEFALSLRHEGYKSVSDFRLARDFKGAYMSGDHLALKEHNDLSEPSDDQSERVARILSEWNPLGDDADSVTDSPPVKIEPLK